MAKISKVKRFGSSIYVSKKLKEALTEDELNESARKAGEIPPNAVLVKTNVARFYTDEGMSYLPVHEDLATDERWVYSWYVTTSGNLSLEEE